MLGLCLVAAFAVAVVAATSASALPEWGECVAKAGGKYLDSNCTKKASLKNPGSFEFKKGKELPNHKFTAHNVGGGGILSDSPMSCSALPELINHKPISRKKCEEEGGKAEPSGNFLTVECESNSAAGEQHSTNQVLNVKVVFKGCKALGSALCENTAEEGTIDTSNLKGNLGYINKAEHRVGLLLTPAKAHGPFASFQCFEGALVFTVGVGSEKEGAFYTPEKTGGYDGIISPITPVNQMTSEFTQVYTINEATGENIPSKFEGKHIDLLETWDEITKEGTGSMWSPAGEGVTDVATPEVPGEIKA